jgi:hypothetical protein
MVGAVILTAEILAAGAYYLVMGSRISVASLEAERAEILKVRDGSVADFEVAGLALPLKVDIHPFYGFGRPPGFEFLSDPQRPEQTDPKAFVVGLTGGSVAWELREQDAIADAVAGLPDLADRNVYVLMLGYYAWKQPQQAAALTYYLTHGGQLDVLINLDGRNEIADTNRNLNSGVFPSHPWLWSALASNTLTQENMALVASQAWWRGNRETAARIAETVGVGITMNTIWKLTDRAIVRKIQRDSGELSEGADPPEGAEAKKGSGKGKAERPFHRFGPRRTFQAPSAATAYAAEIWAESSIQMHHLARANGARYFHFLQPNQYVPNSKALTDDERRRAYEPRREQEIVVGYRALADESKRLESAGVAYVDLTMMFAETRASVYRDRCCHLNADGNALLAEEIGRRVADGLR